ncbi:hypothetical protein FACS1894217_14410 [Clostridia bacterium]|nr:hypothetical protein FACS1894217_14410 [Clostridia bacterium]
MLTAVLDTNVIVSALRTSGGNPAKILDMFHAGEICVCYSEDICAEYLGVLSREKFGFPKPLVEALLLEIRTFGVGVAVSASDFPMPDETDRKFYDVARVSGAFLITGNAKHYPGDRFVLSPKEFCDFYAGDW